MRPADLNGWVEGFKKAGEDRERIAQEILRDFSARDFGAGRQRRKRV